MSNLQDLLARLSAIEEGAKTSDIPAVQRKANNPHGDWKVTKQDLEDEEKEGKISHRDNLAKNSGRADEAVVEPAVVNAPVEECGDDMGGQPDGKNVTMSMQDLLSLINGIQKGVIPSDDGHALMGDREVGEEFGNAPVGAPGPEVKPVAAVLPTGDDMHSKGDEAPKVNGGGNPMQEALVASLHELYAHFKESK